MAHRQPDRRIAPGQFVGTGVKFQYCASDRSLFDYLTDEIGELRGPEPARFQEQTYLQNAKMDLLRSQPGIAAEVLALLLMIGGVLGALEVLFLPAAGAGFRPLVSMGAILAGRLARNFTETI